VRGQQKRAGFNDQNSKAEIFAATVEFVGDVSAEHTRPDYYDVERIAAVVSHLRPTAAHPTAQYVVGK
jgi:hypothetical protein